MAGDVISRGNAKLVKDGKLDLIKGTRNVNVPSRSFYVDDLMVFSKGKSVGLNNLKDLFTRYVMASGQLVNTSKSTIFAGLISDTRFQQLSAMLSFNIGSLPFNYLGLPVFTEKPKFSHLQPIADKIKEKLSAWKACLLSMAGGEQLVRSVIQSMLMYSISIYSLPMSLIKDAEKWIINFVLSGDVEKR